MISLDNRGSITDNPAELDPKIFAHIHLDNRLIGSHLQGDTFARSSDYILKSLDFMITNKNSIGIDPKVGDRIKESLEKTRSLFENLVKSEQMIEQIKKSLRHQIAQLKNIRVSYDNFYTSHVVNKKILISDIYKTISAYSTEFIKDALRKPTEPIMISGGWEGSGEPGHQMVYEFIPNPDGSYTFLVFNTGAGIDKHLRTSKIKDKFSPIKAFHIEKGLSTEDLTRFVNELLWPSIVPGIDEANHHDWQKARKYDENRVYQEVINKVYMLNAKEIDPRPFSKKTTQGQLAGTCTMRVLMPMLHVAMQGEAFQQYLYQLRLQSIIDHYRIQKKANKLTDPMIQRQLSEAISKLARTTHKFMKRQKNKNPVLTEEQGNSYLELLKSIENDLKASLAMDKEQKLSAEFAIPKPLEDTFEVEISANETLLQARKEDKEKQDKDIDSQDKTQGLDETILALGVGTARSMPKRDQHGNLVDFLKACYKVLVENDKQGLSETILYEIEKLFSGIPLNSTFKNYIGSLEKDEISPAMDYLQGILRIYGKHCSHINPYPNPRQTMTSYTALMLGNVISDQYFKGAKGISTLSHLSPAFAIPELESVSLDPFWDQRMDEISKFSEVLKQGKLEDLSRIQKSHETKTQEEQRIPGGSIINMLDYQFLHHYIDEKTRKELHELATNYESNSEFDNIRINLYRLARGSEKTTSDNITKVLKDYERILHFKQLTDECGLFKKGYYDYFQSKGIEVGDEYSDRIACMYFSRSLNDEKWNTTPDQYSSRFEFEHRPMAQGSIKNTLQQFLGLAADSPADLVLFGKPYILPLPDTSNEALKNALHLSDPKEPTVPPKKDLPFTRLKDNECRVIVTKNFFESNLDLLNSKEYQTIFLDNLFTPKTLLKTLGRNKTLAQELFFLLDRGLRFHSQNNELTNGGIFCLQAMVHLYKYLKIMPDHPVFKEVIEKIIHQQKNLDELIEHYQKNLIYKEGKQKANLSKLNDLLTIEFIRTSTLNPDTISYNRLKNHYACLFQNKQMGKGNQNSYLYHESLIVSEPMKKTLHDHFLKLDKDEQQKLIDELIEQLLVPELLAVKSYTTTFSYPLAIIQSKDNQTLVINLSRGTIASLENRIGLIPKEAYDPTFIGIFGNAPIKAGLRDQGNKLICEFDYPQEKADLSKDQPKQPTQPKRHYKLIFDSAQRTSSIQALFPPDNLWYEIVPNNNIPDTLPVGAHSRDKLIWREVTKSEKPQFYITDKNAIPLFELKPTKSMVAIGNLEHKIVASDTKIIRIKNPVTYQCYELNRDGSKTQFALLNKTKKDLYEYFGRIEDIKDIEILQATDPKKSPLRYKVKLPRYELELEGNAIKNNGIEFVLKEDKNLRLLKTQQGLMQGFSHCLFFENKKTKEMIAWVPKQSYFATSEHQHEYYKMQYDLSNKIPKEILYKKNLGILPWKQENSQSFYRYKIEGDELIANTSSDYLNLAYLYLANHNPTKAMEVLRKCKSIDANEEEIALIMKILIDTPPKDFHEAVGSSKLYNDARTNEPDTAAVRLYAASLLAEQRQISLNTPKFEMLESFDTEKQYATANEAYRYYQRYKISQFYSNEFPTIAKKIHKDYYARLDNVSIDLQVLPAKELAVMGTAFHGVPPTKPNSIRNRWRQLELGQLAKEKSHLIKKQANIGLEEVEKLALEQIREQLKSGNQMLITEQSLAEKIVPILPPSKEDLNLLASFLRSKPITSIDPLDLSVISTPEAFLNSFWKLFTYAVTPISDDYIYDKEYKMKKAMEEKKAHLERLSNYFKNFLASKPNVIRHPEDKFDELLIACRLLSYVFQNPEIRWPNPYQWDLNSKKEIQQFLENSFEICNEIHQKTPLTYTLVEIQEESDKSHPKALPDEKTRAETPATPILFFDKAKPQVTRAPLKSFLRKIDGQDIELLPASMLQAIRDIDSISSKELMDLFSDKDKTEERFIAEKRKHFNLDLSKGADKNYARKLKNELYQKILSENQVALLKAKLKDTLLQEEKQLKQQLDSLLQLANQAISGKNASLATRAKMAGKQIVELKLNDLIWLYLQEDRKLFKQKTQLDDKSIAELYQVLHEYLSNKTQHQHYKRIQASLIELETLEKSTEEYNGIVEKLGDALSSKRSYDPALHPELLVFEYFDDIRIRPEQSHLLQRLIAQDKERGGFNNEIIQLIMGGGKSKVLLPLLALKKATGLNLSIIEVPASLFETNVTDLQATTERLFGKKAYPLLFDRDTDCSTTTLRQLYKTLNQQVRIERNYLITTAESIQSLELKYLELMGKTPIDPEQIEVLEKILTLIKQKGDALIDECDTVLDSKRELNYTHGDKRVVPKNILESILNIYKLFDQVEIKLPSMNTTLYDVMLGKAVIPTDESWQEAFNHLATVLINHPKSPLNSLTNRLDKDKKEILFNYLLNRLPSLPDLISTFNPEERNLIALVKGELELFRTTLRRKPNEHYGFPLSRGYPSSKELAIPYMANNTPNEKAEFGSIYEIINYTIQLQKQQKIISIGLIRQFIGDFDNRAKEESTKSRGKISYKDTLGAKEFFRLTGIPLSKIDLDNEKELSNWQHQISQHELSYDYILLNYVLSQVKQYPSILRSNGINHISQYRSAQGITGTPWNVGSYHPRLHFDQSLSLGTDGQTIDLLMKKNPKINVITDNSPEAVIKRSIVEHLQTERIRAFIDVGAIFKGISNLAIAEKIASALASRPNNKIRVVLYFNDENVLCALPFHMKPGENDQPASLVIGKSKLIGSTDPKAIKAMTDESTPDQCFTYYDQRHTTGTDIKQAQDTIGITSIDIDTKARDLWQGAMRLRQLAANQTIEIVMPKAVAETKAGKKDWQIDDVVQLVQKNQVNSLGEMHLRAAIDKMEDLIRNALLDKIYQANDIQSKVKLRKQFSSVLVTQVDEDPFVKFGHTDQWTTTEEILNYYVKECIIKYQRLATQANVMRENEPTLLMAQLEQIKSEALLNTLGEYKHVPSKEEDQQVQVQRVKEQRKETRKERQTEKHLEVLWEGLPERYKPWGFHFPLQPAKDKNNYPVGITRLYDMVATSSLPGFQFSNNIYVTENYSHTVQNQKNLLDYHIKPINFFLLIKEPRTGELNTLIITQEEATEFMAYLDKYPQELAKEGQEVWITSSHNTLLAGTSDQITHPEYPKILEQIQYFNCDLDMLAEKPDYEWLLENYEGKLSFLENQLMQNHPEQMKFMDIFKDNIKKITHQRIIDTKIDMEEIYQAIRSQDLKGLESQLTRLQQVKFKEIIKVMLNTTSTKDGLTLLETAVMSKDPTIVNRLLNELYLQDSQIFEHSSMRMALLHYNEEVFETLLAHSKITLRLDDPAFEMLADQVLATKNPKIMIPFLQKMKLEYFNVNQYWLKKIETLSSLGAKVARDQLQNLSILSTPPLKIWQEYLKKIAEQWPPEVFIKVVSDWQKDPPIPELSDYLKGSLVQPSLLKNIYPPHEELFKRLLQQDSFTLRAEDIDSWVEALKIQNKSVVSLVLDKIKTLDESTRSKIADSKALFEYYTILLNVSFPSLGWERGRGIKDFYVDLLLKIIQVYPGIKEIQIFNHLFDLLITLKDNALFLIFHETISKRQEPEAREIANSMIEIAIKYNKWEFVKTLMQKGIQPKKTETLEKLLAWAVKEKNLPLARQLIEQGINVNILDPTYGKGGPPLLGVAMQSGSVEMTELFLKAGADLSIKSSWLEYTPMEIAFSKYGYSNEERRDIARMIGQCILKFKGDPNYEQYNGDNKNYRQKAIEILDLKTIGALDDLKLFDDIQFDLETLLIKIIEKNSLEAMKFMAQRYPKVGSWRIYTPGNVDSVLSKTIKQKNGEVVLNMIEAGFVFDPEELAEAAKELNIVDKIKDKSILEEKKKSEEVQQAAQESAQEDSPPPIIFTRRISSDQPEEAEKPEPSPKSPKKSTKGNQE